MVYKNPPHMGQEILYTTGAGDLVKVPEAIFPSRAVFKIFSTEVGLELHVLPHHSGPTCLQLSTLRHETIFKMIICELFFVILNGICDLNIFAMGEEGISKQLRETFITSEMISDLSHVVFGQRTCNSRSQRYIGIQATSSAASIY